MHSKNDQFSIRKKNHGPNKEPQVSDTTASKDAAEVGSGSGWLTRNEASDLTGLSPQTFANYERRGMLHPKTVYRRSNDHTDRRVIVYKLEELQKLRWHKPQALLAQAPGEIVARVCELFREGKTKEDVILELRLTFDDVDSFYNRWLDTTGATFVISPDAKAEIEEMIGPFADISELITRIAVAKASSV